MQHRLRTPANIIKFKICVKNIDIYIHKLICKATSDCNSYLDANPQKSSDKTVDI